MISFNSASFPGFRRPESIAGNSTESSPQGQPVGNLFAALMAAPDTTVDGALPDESAGAAGVTEQSPEHEGAEGALPESLLVALAELAQALDSGSPEDLSAGQRALLRSLSEGDTVHPGLSGRHIATEPLAAALRQGRLAALSAAVQQPLTAPPATTGGDQLLAMLAAAAGDKPQSAQSPERQTLELLGMLATRTSNRDAMARQLTLAPGATEFGADGAAMSALRTTASEWAPVKVDTSHSQWARELVGSLGERLSMQISQQVKEASVRLDPPELGKVELIVRMDGDRFSVHLNASNAGVRDMLAQHAERLRQDLLAQNLQIADVQVGQEGHRHQHQQPAYQVPDRVAAHPETDASNDQPAADIMGETRWLSTSA